MISELKNRNRELDCSVKMGVVHMWPYGSVSTTFSWLLSSLPWKLRLAPVSHRFVITESFHFSTQILTLMIFLSGISFYLMVGDSCCHLWMPSVNVHGTVSDWFGYSQLLLLKRQSQCPKQIKFLALTLWAQWSPAAAQVDFIGVPKSRGPEKQVGSMCKYSCWESEGSFQRSVELCRPV